MSHPLFHDLCVDFDELLSRPCLRTMLRIADGQSRTKQAVLKTQPLKFDPHSIEQDCPLYFGMFVEWLVFHFIDQYGKYWNLESPKMTTTTNNETKDVGIDGTAITPMATKMKKLKNAPPAKPGAPVFIQVKGSLNPTKVYKPNDGSRLGNFFAAAQHQAKRQRQSYNARYFIIHTGKRLDHWFSNYADYEEINFDDISINMDGSYSFLNKLRASVGLEPLPIPLCEMDKPEDD